MSTGINRDAMTVRVKREADSVWFAYVDINGDEFWSGGPYGSETEAHAHARRRMQFFLMLLSAPDKP